MNKSSENTGQKQGSDAPTDAAGTAGPLAHVPRRIKVWWWVRALGLVIGAPLLMAVIATVLLIGREISAPSWIVRDVEARAGEVLAGGSLDFADMKITIGTDLHPRLVLSGTVLRDADGAILARVPRIESLLSPRGALQGRVLAQDIHLTGAQLSLRRGGDGTVALAFDQGGEARAAAAGFVGLLDQFDGVFDQGALEALEQVRADGLIINYTDARAGRSWILDNGRIALDLSNDAIDMRADVAVLSGRAYVTTAQFSYVSARGTRAADIGVNITDAAAADIASQSPLLSWLGVLDAPISGAVRGQLDDDGALVTASATLQIAAGQLQPALQTRPIPFRAARTYLTFDPARDRLTFDLLEIDSDYGTLTGTAQTYLREYRDGWPEALLGQVQFSDLTVAPDGVFDTPVVMTDGSVDFRLRLDPFTLDIGQAVGMTAGTPLHMDGQVRATPQGWAVAVDAQADAINAAQVTALWPADLAPKTRTWFADNILKGDISHAQIAFRSQGDDTPRFATTLDFAQAEVRFIPDVAPVQNARGAVSLIDRRVAVTLDAGHIAAPQGGRLDLAGSTFVIPVTGIPNAPATIDLSLQGRITAALSVLSQPPFNVLEDSNLPVTLAQGDARIRASVTLPLGREVTPDQLIWRAQAELRNVRSDVLVPGVTVTATGLQLVVDPESLIVRGGLRAGDIGGQGVFSRALGAGAQGSARLEAQININAAFLEAFNITLPAGMITGEASAQLVVDLGDPAAPAFRLTSDLRGIALSLANVAWTKDANTAGALTVVGVLGDTARIDELSITAPGLQTTGVITFADGGGLERAAFERVRLGGWLDAPVILLGRGAGQPVAVQIAGGALDLRAANFGAGGGDGGPLDIALDRLTITDRIQIDDFRGTFAPAGGLQGEFVGILNGIAPINGTLVAMNGGAAVRITSADAGSVLRATGLLRTAFGGDLDLTLLPTGRAGSYDGTLVGRAVSVRDAPVLASLLDAVSVVGLLNQMEGRGLVFDDIDVAFRLTPDQVIVTQASAIGPGLGLSMDGVYSSAAGVMDFQGVISPFFLVNNIGSVLTRRGEGLIGFSFNLRGNVDNPQVLVNPLSALTPGMFREIFRRPPPQLDQ